MESRMTPAALHSLILSSSLPESKWPCKWLKCDCLFAVEGWVVSLTSDVAALLFVAVLVEELCRTSCPTIRLIKGDWTIALELPPFHRVNAPTLLEALCIAYRETSK